MPPSAPSLPKPDAAPPPPGPTLLDRVYRRRGAEIRRLAAVIRQNAFWRRRVFCGKRAAKRQLLWTGVPTAAILAGSGAMAFLAGRMPLAILLLLYLLMRTILLVGADLAAARAARRDLDASMIGHLYLSNLKPADCTLGWALMGWARMVPVTLIGFAALYPWFWSFGVAGWLIPWAELMSVLALQGLAAMASANLALKGLFSRQGAGSGSTLALLGAPAIALTQSIVVLALPLIALVSIVLGLLYLLLVVIMALIASNGIDAALMMKTAAIAAGLIVLGSYYYWLPGLIAEETIRQLGFSSHYARSIFHQLERTSIRSEKS